MSNSEKYVCEWCGAKSKTIPSGLCPVCCRFPSTRLFEKGISKKE